MKNDNDMMLFLCTFLNIITVYNEFNSNLTEEINDLNEVPNFSLILHLLYNNRISPFMRPKTLGYWNDVFPLLSDNYGNNSFKSHFKVYL